MWIGIDDTDSRNAGCTTYIAFRIVSTFADRVSSLPRLVRLNPNLKYKTRGNGALSVRISSMTGGEKTVVGRFDRNEISLNLQNDDTYPDFPEIDDKSMMEKVREIVEEYYEKNQPNTNPGIVISSKKFDADIYRRALENDIPMDYIEEILKRTDSIYHKIGNGRGIIGATSSIAWDRKRTTYELLNYKYPKAEYVDDEVKTIIGKIAESYESTFNNMELEDGKICLFPKDRTPVIYGIRGLVFDDLIQIQEEINSRFPDFERNYMIFATNQGTDDHIIKLDYGMEPRELASYEITGFINELPFRKEGGHLFFGVKAGDINIRAAAFEPSKGFRDELDKLEIGDQVKLFGSYSRGTIKIEKLELIHPATIYERRAPLCSKCGSRTVNIGSLKYRCTKCSNTMEPEYVKNDDKRKALKLEPPAYARRHLSMPWKLEGASFRSNEYEV